MAIKRKTCKHCHMKILADAKVCPYCGKKQGGKHTMLIIVLILIFGIAGGACWYFKDNLMSVFNKNTSNIAKSDNIEDSNAEETTNDSDIAIEEGSYTVGQSVNIDGFQITLSKAILSEGDGKFIVPDEGKYFLALIFDIDNQSSKDFYISEICSFEAYCDDYSIGFPYSLSSSIPEVEGIDSLSGDVASGKKSNGVTVYEILKDFSKFEIYFYNSNLSSDKILFTITKDNVDTSNIK